MNGSLTAKQPTVTEVLRRASHADLSPRWYLFNMDPGDPPSQSGRGLPQSKTLRELLEGPSERQLLDGASSGTFFNLPKPE